MQPRVSQHTPETNEMRQKGSRYGDRTNSHPQQSAITAPMPAPFTPPFRGLSQVSFPPNLTKAHLSSCDAVWRPYRENLAARSFYVAFAIGPA